MIRDNLFEIPMWSLPCLNFKKKKEQLVKLLKLYPEKRIGIQNFATNRQSDRPNLKEAFSNVLEEELGMLVQSVKADVVIEDIWSVSYKKGDYHTPHDHGTVGLSGILYLNMPKDAPVTQYIQPWNDWQTDRTNYYPLPVKEGDIVVLPRFIRHFTEPSKSKKIKRVISWDMNLQNG